MKHMGWIVCAVLVIIASTGCNLKKQMEDKAKEAVNEAVNEAVTEAVTEAAATEEAAEEAMEAESDMAVAKEDIDKVVEIYKILHAEDVSKPDAVKKTDEKLEEFGWDRDRYQEIQFEISKDPASRTYYQEQTEA
jgi:predicted RecB family endonuclease